jgi:hypothetical protein
MKFYKFILMIIILIKYAGASVLDCMEFNCKFIFDKCQKTLQCQQYI